MTAILWPLYRPICWHSQLRTKQFDAVKHVMADGN